jgi:hypothetical protein
LCRFHGFGTIHFLNGGKYEATWNNGVAVEVRVHQIIDMLWTKRYSQGKYTFKDGLEYAEENWNYCTKGDRRFFHERVEGFTKSI